MPEIDDFMNPELGRPWPASEPSRQHRLGCPEPSSLNVIIQDSIDATIQFYIYRQKSQIIEAQLKAIIDAEGITPEQAKRRYELHHDNSQIIPIEVNGQYQSKTICRIVRKRAAKGKPAGSQVGYAVAITTIGTETRIELV